MFNSIKPGEKLRNRHIKLRGNVFVDIYLRQQSNQFWRFMHEHTMLLRPGDDRFGDQAFALGNDARGGIRLAVGEGDGLAGGVIRRFRRVQPVIGSN